MSISMFDTRTMIQALEQMPQVRTFLRDTFFRNERRFDTENIDIDVYKGKRRVASYVSPLSQANVVARDGFATSTYKAPYIKEKTVTTAQDYLKRSAGETVYPNGMTPRDRAADQLAKDLMYLDERITRAEEIQAAQALFAGEITVLNGDKISFGLASTHKITLSGNDLWSDTTNSDPLEKLREWRRLLLKDGGIVPNVIIMSTEALNAFLKHPKVKDGTGAISSIKVDRGIINPQAYDSGVTYWGYVNELACDIWTYDEWYLDASGNEQPMVPAKYVFMGSTNARMDRNYGVIQDLEANYAVPRFPSSWTEKDPSRRMVMLQSAPLLVPVQVDSFLFAKVLS